VGIATLYRRFPDRPALMRAVVLDVLGRTAHQARQALAHEPDAFQALIRYMHRAVDLRVAAVIPALLGQVSLDDQEMQRARNEASRPLQAIIDAAHAAGTLRPEVTFADIGLLVIRFSRPLPGGFPPDLNDRLAHRRLDLLIPGLAEIDTIDPKALRGPALTLDDLRALSPQDMPNRADLLQALINELAFLNFLTDGYRTEYGRRCHRERDQGGEQRNQHQREVKRRGSCNLADQWRARDKAQPTTA
jgi:AcrR family transcriptional regulator